LFDVFDLTYVLEFIFSNFIVFMYFFYYDRHYGDVEEITVEEPLESRLPLYAHVIFSHRRPSSMSLMVTRVKFMTRGKHLWARQFVPKKKKADA
jgi:hypothetical protein